MRSMNRFERTAATLALLVVPGFAPPLPGGFVNGDFQQGFAGWKTKEFTRTSGQAQADAQLAIDDSLTFVGGDQTMAELSVTASAGSLGAGAGPGNSAVSVARLEQELSAIPSTSLSLQWASGFGATVFANGTIRWSAKLRVRHAGPFIASREAARGYELEFLGGRIDGEEDCGVGFAVDGRPINPHRVDIDLAAAGFEPGDDVVVSVEFQVLALAPEACDFVGFGGSLWVDRFILNPPKVRKASL